MKGILTALIVLGALGGAIFAITRTPGEQKTIHQKKQETMAGSKLDTATFGAGCFWCTEAIFQSIKGVQSVVSGYSGGDVANPTYEQVCSGTTGHAEASQITFDPGVVSFAELLEVFWKTHDPTTLNRQGNDVGTQYRSVIFYRSPEQKRLAEHYKRQLDSAGAFGGPIVTEIVPLRNFYPAESYHQNYYRQNGMQPYCMFVISPKMEKFRKAFKEVLKSGSE